MSRSWWCHPTISSCRPLLRLPSIFPASGSFQMSQLFASGGQSIGVSASTSVLPKNIQDWFPFRMHWLDLCAIQGTLKSLLQHHSSKASVLQHSTFITVQLVTSIHDYWKNNSLDEMDICCQSNVSVFSMLSRLVITFLPRSKHLLISWLQSPSSVTLEPPKIKSVTVSTVSPSICHEVMGLDAMIFVFWMLSQQFHSTLLLSPRGTLVLLHFLP